MKYIKNLKKILSMVLLIVLICAMLPANIFAATIMDENYSTTPGFVNNFGWKTTTSPTHAVLQKTNTGIKILQTVQTRYAEGSTTANNTVQDGQFEKGINTVIKSDLATGMEIRSIGAKGNVKITIDYVIDQTTEKDGGTG